MDVALLTATTYAYTGGRMGTSVSANSAPTGISYGSYYGGMMTGRGMMGGYGYSTPTGSTPQQSGLLSTTSTKQPNQYPIGSWGCAGMRNRLP